MIIALDLETSWLDYNNDKIIEIWLVKFDENTFEIIDSFSSLINPWIFISEEIENLTWITNEDLEKAPYFDELIDKINDFLKVENLVILWHNVSFDLKFLSKYWIDLRKIIIVDTFLLANFIYYNNHSLSLESLAKDLWLENKNSHRALWDVFTTILLFKKEIEFLKNLKKEKKDILYYIFSISNDKWILYILNKYFRQKKTKVDKNKYVKIILSTIKNKLIKIDKIEKKQNLENKNFSNIIDNIGQLEVRQNQLEMWKIVEESLDKNKKVVIEAPTWVWKTLAYLIPSIIYSKKKNVQVFISTSTKALQDQIFYKDLDFLEKNLWIEFSYSKLKWKANYFWVLSFFRFFESLEEINLEITSFLLKISFFILETNSFELDELDYYWKEFLYKKMINADDKLIFSTKNIYLKYEPLIYFRKKAKKSDIVIINNNILFQDIENSWNLLWKIKNLVIDESHNIEDTITNSLKESINLYDLKNIFDSIKKIFLKNKINFEEIEKILEKLYFDLELLFDVLKDYLSYKMSTFIDTDKVLIEADFYDFLDNNIDKNKIFMSILSNLLNIRDLLVLIPDQVFLDINRQLSYLDSFEKIIRILQNKKRTTENILIISSHNIKWISLEYTLLNIWKFLEDKLFSKLDSCILTSATLKTWNNFDYLKNILHLNDFDFYELDSDFDYNKQALLYVPDDLWNIKNNLEEVADFLEEFIKIVSWNTLVLFTSFKIIREIYSKINRNVKNLWSIIYTQNLSSNKHKIISFFREDPNKSIIFWTDTFWEWIDISWDDLKYLIIHKIPFEVPSEPIFLARSKLFSNPFLDYSIPKAILKLKQWFWRLIRTKNDKGIIIFLDDRIFTTRWWEKIFYSFPKNINYKKWSSKKLLEILSQNKNIKK